jgi:hypothetical protein
MTDDGKSGVRQEREERDGVSQRAGGGAGDGGVGSGAGGSGGEGGEYLWDRTGPVDPAVQDLEKTLGVFGVAGRGGGLGARRAHGGGRGDVVRARRRKLAAVAGGLLVLLLAIAVWTAIPSSRVGELARMDGSSTGVMVDGQERASGVTLRPEMMVATKEHASARMALAHESRVELGDQTEVRIVDARAASFAVELRSGEVIVSYAAAAGSGQSGGVSPLVRVGQTDLRAIGATDFFVGTSEGEFFVELKRGAVEAVFQKTRTRVAPGCRMEISGKAGPRVPVAYGASREFAGAMRKLEGIALSDPSRAEMVGWALKNAEKTDAFTLWNLVSRGTPAERSVVLKKAEALGVVPAGIDRLALVKGDAAEMDRWWGGIVGGK